MWKKASLKPQKSSGNTASSGDLINKILIENVGQIKEDLGDCSDLIVRMIKHKENPFAFAVIHIDGISNTPKIDEHVIEPILTNKFDPASRTIKDELQQVIAVTNIKEKNSFKDILSAIVSGGTVILIDGDTSALILDTKEIESRSIEEPTTQTVIRGPKDSFTENLRTNTSLVRSRIQSPNLRLDSMKIGEVTQTQVEIMYIKGIADESIVKEVKNRLQKIKVDGILESAYIEGFIEDEPRTPFPTVQNTERPDAVIGNLLEGRVAIFMTGTPGYANSNSSIIIANCCDKEKVKASICLILSILLFIITRFIDLCKNKWQEG